MRRSLASALVLSLSCLAPGCVDVAEDDEHAISTPLTVDDDRPLDPAVAFAMFDAWSLVHVPRDGAVPVDGVLQGIDGDVQIVAIPTGSSGVTGPRRPRALRVAPRLEVAIRSGGDIEAVVTFADVPVELDDIVDQLTRTGFDVSETWATGRMVRATAPHSAWDALLDRSIVRAAWTPLALRTQNETSARWMGADAVYGTDEVAGFTGASTVLGIVDGGGVDARHPDLAGRAWMLTTDEAFGGRCPRYSDHATHVAGTMTSLGLGDARARGIAWGAPLIVGDIFCDVPIGRTEAMAAGVDVSNHSYGLDAGWVGTPEGWFWVGDLSFGRYEGDSRLVDVMIDRTDHVFVVAAGNERNDGPEEATDEEPRDCHDDMDCLVGYSTAKNALVIGGLAEIVVDEDTGAESLRPMGMSSRGPTDDGRVKPDVAARGRDVFSTLTGREGRYTAYSGTSMASPGAAGAIGLLIDAYKAHHGGVTPSSALVRALVVQTARSAGPSGRPDRALGHGLVQIDHAIELVQRHGDEAMYLFEGVNGRRSSTDRFEVTTTRGEPLVVTLAWRDVPGEANFRDVDDPTPALVNDLDVAVRAADGTTYYPWAFDPADRMADARNDGPNRRDTVERIVVPAGDTDDETWEIFVRRNGGLFDNRDQPWALVSSHPMSPDGVRSLDAIRTARGTAVRMVDGGADLDVSLAIGSADGTDHAWAITSDVPEWLRLDATEGTTAGGGLVATVLGDRLPTGPLHRVELSVDADGTTTPMTLWVTGDNCVEVENPDQADRDSDGVGDACDVCPDARNPDQGDDDGDGLGNACDVCPAVSDPDQVDLDSDGAGDLCDSCPDTPNPGNADTDGDGAGDACADRDGDGLVDGPDVPLVLHAWVGSEFDLLPDIDTLGPPTFSFGAYEINARDGGGPVMGNPRGIADLVVIRVDMMLRVPFDGPYELHLTSDDGSRLYLAGEMVIDNDGLHGMETVSATIDLEAGWYELRAEMFEKYGGAGMELEWTNPWTGVREIIPHRYLTAADNCPDDPNPDQLDTDGDGIGDICQPAPPEPEPESDAGDVGTGDSGIDTSNDVLDAGSDTGFDAATDALDLGFEAGDDDDSDSADASVDSDGDTVDMDDTDANRASKGRSSGCSVAARPPWTAGFFLLTAMVSALSLRRKHNHR